MNPRLAIGVALVILGIVALANGGFNLGRKKERMEFGPMSVEVQEQRHVDIPPLAGGLLLAGGVALILWRPRPRA